MNLETELKICSKCQSQKSFVDFKGRDKCKTCHEKEIKAKSDKTYYLKNKARLIAKSGVYRRNNLDKKRAQSKKYRLKHKERLKKQYHDNKEEILTKRAIIRKRDRDKNFLYHKEYREKYYSKQENKIKQAENKRRWRIENKEWRNKQERSRRKLDINFNMACLLRSFFSLSVKKEDKESSVFDVLGCSLTWFKSYIETMWTDGMTWENRGNSKGKWVLDHVIPVSFFDHRYLEEQKKCWHYTNFQPLWYDDNNLKSDFLPDGRRARDIPLVFKSDQSLRDISEELDRFC